MKLEAQVYNGPIMAFDAEDIEAIEPRHNVMMLYLKGGTATLVTSIKPLALKRIPAPKKK